jgi:hypothetical protein
MHARIQDGHPRVADVAKSCASLRLFAARHHLSSVPVFARRYQPRITHLLLRERGLSHAALFFDATLCACKAREMLSL